MDQVYVANKSSSGLEGKQIGQNASTSVHLGKSLGTYATEKEAIKAARGEWGFTDDPDIAVVQRPDGQYELYNIKMPTTFFEDGDDFNAYGEIRSAQLKTSLPGGYQLIAVVSDDNDVRYFGRESSPGQYSRPTDPNAITSAQGTTETARKAVVESLRARAIQALDRLKQMERDLAAQKDHRGIFATTYRVITERAIKEMDEFIKKGDLRAAEFEGALLVNFANRYFDAYDNYARGNLEAVPEVWRAAFDAGRNAEAAGYPKASMTEVLALSMVAHIINDLPQTLQDIGYPQAVDRQKLEAVYDSFNQALMEEKPKIMAALGRNYGGTDIHVLDALGSIFMGAPAGPFGPVVGPWTNNTVQKEIFTWMRTLARERAASMNPSQIQKEALKMSDQVRTWTPGGN